MGAELARDFKPQPSVYLAAAAGIDRVAGQAFNIGGGPDNSLSILELMGLLAEIVGCTLRWTHIAERESDQRVFVADLRRVQTSLAWTPRVGKREGVRRMVDWVRSINGGA